LRGPSVSEFLFLAAGVAMLTVAAGLWRVLRGPTEADRMMAAQLLGTGGIAALLLLAVGGRNWPAVDAALALAVLAAFASLAFARPAPEAPSRPAPEAPSRPAPEAPSRCAPEAQSRAAPEARR